MNKGKSKSCPLNAWCPLKFHTYLRKPPPFSPAVLCMTFKWKPGVQLLKAKYSKSYLHQRILKKVPITTETQESEAFCF